MAAGHKRDVDECFQEAFSDPLNSFLELELDGGHVIIKAQPGETSGEQVQDGERSPWQRVVRTTDPSVGVDRIIEEPRGLLAAEPPLTVGAMFKAVVERVPHRSALCYKDAAGSWKTISFAKYYGLCMAAAKSFVKVRVY